MTLFAADCDSLQMFFNATEWDQFLGFIGGLGENPGTVVAIDVCWDGLERPVASLDDTGLSEVKTCERAISLPERI